MHDILSLAVFAFAVDDINDRDLLITSATPCALLQIIVNTQKDETMSSAMNILLVAIQLSQFDQCSFLMAQSFAILGTRISTIRSFVYDAQHGLNNILLVGCVCTYLGFECILPLHARVQTCVGFPPGSEALPWSFALTCWSNITDTTGIFREQECRAVAGKQKNEINAR